MLSQTAGTRRAFRLAVCLLFWLGSPGLAWASLTGLSGLDASKLPDLPSKLETAAALEQRPECVAFCAPVPRLELQASILAGRVPDSWHPFGPAPRDEGQNQALFATEWGSGIVNYANDNPTRFIDPTGHVSERVARWRADMDRRYQAADTDEERVRIMAEMIGTPLIPLHTDVGASPDQSYVRNFIEEATIELPLAFVPPDTFEGLARQDPVQIAKGVGLTAAASLGGVYVREGLSMVARKVPVLAQDVGQLIKGAGRRALSEFDELVQSQTQRAEEAMARAVLSGRRAQVGGVGGIPTEKEARVILLRSQDGADVVSVPSRTIRTTTAEELLVESGGSLQGGPAVATTVRGPSSGRGVGQLQGREYRTDWLAVHEFDPNVPRHIRGWLKQERLRVEAGRATTPRNPPGQVMAHGRATPAREGFDYSNARLQDADLNALEEAARRRLGKK